MLYYDRIDLSEGIDVAKSNNDKECIVYRYFYFNWFFYCYFIISTCI